MTELKDWLNSINFNKEDLSEDIFHLENGYSYLNLS